ncbi:putative serine/threonine-protein kinase haspin [Scophthalmus maximus]|uniref:non-specific serine/threonine protein kinase n=1 Tax=Scophthalmus maximus TaxID=52904 RepID=A0A2U9BND3_SCOMX|nr:putative serine/threonine-protein kinase haspin [Scophthalmus maximus]
MKPAKSLFLKTYGKQRRKLPAWISPENRKQAFDSTASTDGDVSVFEAAKPTKTRERRTSVASRRAARPAKKKAMLCLTEETRDEESVDNEENIVPSPPQASQRIKTTRGKKTSACGGRAVRPAKRKAVSCQTENSSDEENIRWPSPPRQSKTTSKKSQLASVPGVLTTQNGQKVPVTSQSEDDSTSAPKCDKKSVKTKRDSNVHPRSVGRFVTRRRRGAAAKPKLPKAIVSMLNSSDDFTFGALCSKSTRLPTRRRVKVPPGFLVSSVENSVNATGTFSFATLREISVNELADQSLGPLPRNPIFCSTPSAESFGKRPHLKSFPIDDKSSSPPSLTVSCTGVLSPFQEDRDSPGQLVSPPYSAPSTALHSEGKLQSSLGEREPHLHPREEPSGDFFMEHESTDKRISCSEEAKSYREDSKTKNVGELPSLIELSSGGESGCEFVSATGSLEWLIEALKETCLTNLCTVQLERLDILTVTQLCSQTTYSSCLGLSGSVHSQHTDEHPPSVDSGRTASFNLLLSETIDESGDYLQSENSLESPGQADSVNDGSPSVACEQSAEYSSASVLYDESSHHTLSSVDFIMGTQLPARSPVQSLFTEEEVVAERNKCLAKKCTIQLKKLTSSQLKGCTQQKEANFSCNRRSSYPDAIRSDSDHTCNIDDPEDLTRSGGTTGGMLASVRLSINSSSPVAQTQSSESEVEEKVAVLTTMLKEKCLSDKITVEIKRVSISPLKEDKKRNSSTVLSDSASDEQIKTDILPKRKKMSLVPREKKRRSMSTDRPGTTRKVCVSGLSVSRWKNKSAASTRTWAGDVKSVDCSINELISTKHKQPRHAHVEPTQSRPLCSSQRHEELSRLKEKKQNQTHSFIGLNDLHCVRGCYPPDFLKAWDTFDQQKGSENDRPDFFEQDQLFLILEFEFGGADLENSNGTLASLGVAKSILHQVTAALAVAEQELHFEHRDLHWGNVLVKTTKQKTGSFLLNGTVHSLETKGVLVRIIDYSLSRLEIDDLTVSCDISNDEELFMGQGDYQFDIYRLMRQENGNDWGNFHPHTNVLWLHYLCSKLLSMKYRGSGGRGAKDTRVELTRFYDNVLEYSSATEALQRCPMFQ